MYHRDLGTVIKFRNSTDTQELIYEIRSTWVEKELKDQLNVRSWSGNQPGGNLSLGQASIFLGQTSAAPLSGNALGAIVQLK